MRKIIIGLVLSAAAGFSSGLLANDQTIIQDGDAEMSFDEFAYKVTRWTPQMREVALVDEGDRLELINLALANKKLADYADEFVADDSELYWEYVNGLQTYQRDFVLRKYSNDLQTPDFSELAKEQYVALKEKYAAVPERRMSSHILFSSPPGLPREEVTIKAQGVLDQLRAGADFEEMVAMHSGEPNAAEKKGKFNRWVSYGEIGVSPRYSEGLFTIGTVGEYSELVNSQFGIHIIRLDGVQEKSYKTFEEVKSEIEKGLEADYRKLAMKEFISQFQMSDKVVIDNDAVETILKPYAEKE
ncbi:MAG: peptidylprolyl isomerase [Halioglobus sp.]